MSINRVTRAEKLLSKLVETKKLSPHGRDWLICALDPFHDTRLDNLAGWPDMSDQPSLVRCYKSSKTITAPAGVEEGATWDAVINTYPVANTSQLGQVPVRAGNHFVVSNSSNNRILAPVLVRKYQPDASWSPNNLNYESEFLTLPDEISRGNGRLIGMGFEVVNTTAELYKQGTCYVYEFPQPTQLESFTTGTLVNDLWVPNTTGFGTTILSGPGDEDQIMLLPGSRFWEASKGNYSVVPFRDQHNPAGGAVDIMIQFAPELDQNQNTTQSINPCMANPNHYANIGSSTISQFNSNRLTNTHSTGAAYTGLSKQTALTVTAIFYYEQFPGVKDTQIVTLATPSGSYDPVALELYSLALSEMPIAVPAGMNGLGEWFAGAISRLAPIIGSLLTPIAGPMAPAIGLAAKGAADAYLSAPGGNRTPKRLVAPTPPSRTSSKTRPKRALAARAPSAPPRTTTTNTSRR